LHWLLLLGPIVFLLAATMGFAGLGSKPMPLPVAFAMLPMAVLMTVLWAMFIALRTTVTKREVVIQYGVFGPRIPLERIDACRVVDEPLLALGGGVKRFRGAWAYTLWGQGTRVVRLEWHNAHGAKKATRVSSSDPDALAAAVEHARGATYMRIDAGGDAEVDQGLAADGSESDSEQKRRHP
jgi:hypothetical protein